MPASRTWEQVDDELNAAFLAHWIAAGENGDRIAWDLDDFDATTVPDFVLFQLQHNTGSLAGITGGTSQFVRRLGIVSAVVYVRKGVAKTRRQAMTEVVMDFLEQLNVAGMSFEDPGFDDVGLVNGWQQVNCTAQARYDILRTA